MLNHIELLFRLKSSAEFPLVVYSVLVGRVDETGLITSQSIGVRMQVTSQFILQDELLSSAQKR